MYNVAQFIIDYLKWEYKSQYVSLLPLTYVLYVKWKILICLKISFRKYE